MPIVLRIGGYSFFFYVMEGNEPPHIHIKHSGRVAKYWLNPVKLADNIGFRPHELTEVRKMVNDNITLLQEAWDVNFPTT